MKYSIFSCGIVLKMDNVRYYSIIIKYQIIIMTYHQKRTSEGRSTLSCRHFDLKLKL